MLLALNLAVSGAFLTLILLTQVLIYPSFLRVPQESFSSYHAFHCKRITWIVAPLAALDLSLALALVLNAQAGAELNALLAGLPVLFTFVYFVPLHKKLSEEASPMLMHRLTKQNFWRTLFWSLKFLWAFYLIWELT